MANLGDFYREAEETCDSRGEGNGFGHAVFADGVDDASTFSRRSRNNERLEAHRRERWSSIVAVQVHVCLELASDLA